jgi:hypothetical protein
VDLARRDLLCWAFLLSSSVFIALVIAPRLHGLDVPASFIVNGGEL